MSISAAGGARWRNNPFNRGSHSPSPVPVTSGDRPKPAIVTSPTGGLNSVGHNRNQSFSPLSGSNIVPPRNTRQRSLSNRSGNQASNTFAPQFIKTGELERTGERVGGIDGENDFSGKRYVWLRDPQMAFTKGCVLEELVGGRLLVQCEDGSVSLSALLDSVRNIADYHFSKER